MSAALSLAKYRSCLEGLMPIQAQCSVAQVVGLVVESIGPACRLGAVCDILTRQGGRRLAAEALGFRDNRVLLMPLEEIR
ncbi:MAG: flagellum-specific ATP synthase FliI, partial [Desulfobacterales bacterium]|nr:flagellum-specific ATP synthase FliI [Desulfobacterales bacterium]